MVLRLVSSRHQKGSISKLSGVLQAGARELEERQAAGQQAAREGEEIRAQIEVDADREVEMQRERCAATLPAACWMLAGASSQFSQVL